MDNQNIEGNENGVGQSFKKGWIVWNVKKQVNGNVNDNDRREQEDQNGVECKNGFQDMTQFLAKDGLIFQGK